MAIEKILNKRSNDVVTGGNPKRPTSSQLDNGEIAVNYHKGTERLFIKNDNEEVVDFIPKNEVEANYYDKDDTDTLLAGKQDTINDLAAIRSGAQAGSTAVQPADLTQIDNRLDDVEYCLGDYLKDTYVFNWENHTTTTTEPIYTTRELYTVDGGSGFQTCDCRLTAGSAIISALYLGGLGSGTMYFTQSGTVTMYLVLDSNPSSTSRLIQVYDASGNSIEIISTYDIPYNSQHICTPITFEVEAGYYLKISTTSANAEKLIWLGQIDFEIAGVKQIDKDVHTNSAAIEAIEQKIPEQASSSNQLADKNFVNSSIATATATYRGSYNLVSDLLLSVSATQQQIADALATKMAALSITPDNNDYCFVQIPTADATPTEIACIDRYKYDGTAWAYEYSLNNSSFTAAQWAALNSGITSGLVAKLSALPTNSELTTLLNGKVDKENGKGLSANDYTTADKNKLGDLPTNSELTTALAGKQATLTAGDNIAISSNVISASNEGWEHAADQFAVSGTTAYGQKIVSAYSTLDISDVKKGTFRLYNSVAYNGDMTTKHFKVEAIYTGGTVTLYDVEVGAYETKELSFTANIDSDCTIRVTNGLLRNSVGFYSENAYKEYTKTLAPVATSGSYNDLSDKPTIPDITGKADKVSNATNGNFAALDSNGNLIDSGHKHSDYLTSHQDLSNYVQKSQTAGLLKNDGTVDTNTYLTQHQDISGKENVMPITTATGETLSAVVGNYYRLNNVGTLAITLPTITGATKLQAITFLLVCGSSSLVTFAPQGSETILYQEDFALENDTTYEVTALWNGSEWTLSRVIYE